MRSEDKGHFLKTGPPLKTNMDTQNDDLEKVAHF